MGCRNQGNIPLSTRHGHQNQGNIPYSRKVEFVLAIHVGSFRQFLATLGWSEFTHV